MYNSYKWFKKYTPFTVDFFRDTLKKSHHSIRQKKHKHTCGKLGVRFQVSLKILESFRRNMALEKGKNGWCQSPFKKAGSISWGLGRLFLTNP